MLPTFRSLAYTVCLYSAACVSVAADTTRETRAVEVAPTLTSASFREFDAGAKAVQESGELAGLCLTYREVASKVRIDLDVCRRQSTLDYSGRTQAGLPFVSESYIKDSGFMFSSYFRFLDYRSLSVSGGLEMGYRIWSRDIRGRGSIAGLEEEFDWRFYGAGLLFEYLVTPRWDIDLSLGFRKPDAAEAEIRFLSSPSADIAKLTLASAWTEMIDVELRYALGNHLSLALSAGYENWNLGPSSSVPLTSSGIPLGQTVRQPLFDIVLLNYAISLEAELN